MLTPHKIIRSNRKTLTISIDYNNRLIVRAPYRCGKERIFAFLQDKEAWILRKMSENKSAGIILPPENLHGYEFLLLGKKCKILLAAENRVVYDDDARVLYLPEKNAEKRLVAWLKENALRIFSTVTQRVAKRMETSYQSVSVSSARRKWGSCSFDNAIRYSYRLLYAPKEVIEYVAVHELAHTRYKNHSALFWAEVEKYSPSWKEQRTWLKYHGGLMKIF